MRTPAQGGRRGILDRSEGPQTTAPLDPTQARAAAEATLADACRAMLQAGISPGMTSVAFGRIMAELLEAHHDN